MMICKADSIERHTFGMISEPDTDEWVYSQSQHNRVANDSGYIDGGKKIH